MWCLMTGMTNEIVGPCASKEVLQNRSSRSGPVSYLLYLVPLYSCSILCYCVSPLFKPSIMSFHVMNTVLLHAPKTWGDTWIRTAQTM